MRLIDADALRDKLHEECAECGNCSYYNPDGNCHIYMMLDILEEDALTIDAEPARHGRWEEKPYKNYPAYSVMRCSECGWFIHKSKLRNSDKFNFCPNCGAKMDGGEQNATD